MDIEVINFDWTSDNIVILLHLFYSDLITIYIPKYIYQQPCYHPSLYNSLHVNSVLLYFNHLNYRRFTGHLAKKAASVMAVDFMQSFVEKNRQLNSHHVNIKFIQADVLKLGLPEKRYFDLNFWFHKYIFSFLFSKMYSLFHKTLFYYTVSQDLFGKQSFFPNSNVKNISYLIIIFWNWRYYLFSNYRDI